MSGNIRRGGIFILSNMREYGGAERSIATILPPLAVTLPVRIFAEQPQHVADLEQLAGPRLRVVRCPRGISLWSTGRSFALVLWHFVREHPAVILANGHKGAAMLAALRRLVPWSRARFAVYVRDFGFFTMPRLLKHLGDAIYFAPSQAVFDHPQYRAWGLHEAHCEVVANAVEPATREPHESDPPYIACCARITPWKGIDYLIRAFQRIAAAHPTVRLHIYGAAREPDYMASLRRLSEELGVAGRVDFQSFVGDVDEMYAGGSVFVVSSLSDHPGPETFCRVIIEAWAYRKPVVAFATGGPKHIIRDGVDGFLVAEKNVEQLADRVLELLRDPAMRERMGTAGWRRTQEEFKPEVIARQLLGRLLAK
jgi:glycosyltransferase involved in cell wall biosynthesis